MINADLSQVTTLPEFNKELRKQQEEAHGNDYCEIHDAIKMYITECESYMELGTHQGGTASVAMLCKPKRVFLVDKDMSRYRKFLAPIAQEWCNSQGIDLTVKEEDSTSSTIVNATDMLVIDSYHHPSHMKKELTVHSKNVRKYIIAHDTSIVNGKPNDSLYQTLKQFAEENNWEVIEHNTNNVGYTVIKKK